VIETTIAKRFSIFIQVQFFLQRIWSFVQIAGNVCRTTPYFLLLFVGNMGTKAAMHFVRLVEDDDSAFDNLFCVAFQMLDAQWLERRATYMEFNVSVLFER
jgi:hypothetical protein